MYTFRGVKNKHYNLFGIDVANQAIKCLGVYIEHDKKECFNMNWVKTIDDMEKHFESWNKRKLTLFCKTCIINTLAVSKCIYKASILPYPDESLIKKVQSNIFNFLWNKTDRIKRNTIIGGILDGGIGVIDIETKLKSLKAIWVAKLLKSKNTMYEIIKGYLNKLNLSPEYIVKTSKKNPMISNLSNIFLFFIDRYFLASLNARRPYQYKIFQWQIFYYSPYGAIVYLNVKVKQYVYLTALKAVSDT